MKDEAPYLLEWVAWHRAAGFDCIVALANDCTDGTHEMLSRLHDLGVLTYCPNPVPPGEKPHAAALRLARTLPEVAASEHLMVLDADEFLLVRPPPHTVGVLIDALQAAGAGMMVIPWRIFGSSGQRRFHDRPVTGRFTRSQDVSDRPRVGVKTFFRHDPALRPWIHYPRRVGADAPESRWVDAGMQPLERASLTWKGGPAGLRRDLAEIAHFMVKSEDEYLLKILRGDGMLKVSRLGLRYWEEGDRNEATDLRLDPGPPGFAEGLAALRDDPVLGRLHRRAVRRRKAALARLKALPQVRTLRAILRRSSAGTLTGADVAEARRLAVAMSPGASLPQQAAAGGCSPGPTGRTRPARRRIGRMTGNGARLALLPSQALPLPLPVPSPVAQPVPARRHTAGQGRCTPALPPRQRTPCSGRCRTSRANPAQSRGACRRQPGNRLPGRQDALPGQLLPSRMLPSPMPSHPISFPPIRPAWTPSRRPRVFAGRPPRTRGRRAARHPTAPLAPRRGLAASPRQLRTQHPLPRLQNRRASLRRLRGLLHAAGRCRCGCSGSVAEGARCRAISGTSWGRCSSPC